MRKALKIVHRGLFVYSAVLQYKCFYIPLGRRQRPQVGIIIIKYPDTLLPGILLLLLLIIIIIIIIHEVHFLLFLL